MIKEINPVPEQSLLKLAEASILLSSFIDISSTFNQNEFAERRLCTILDATTSFEPIACSEY